MKLRSGLLAASAFAVAMSGASAFAQDGIEVVTVTAAKRAMDVQDVPISMNVVGAQELNKFNVSSLSGLMAKVPSLMLQRSPTNVGLFMRGYGTGPANPSSDLAVSVYQDGIPQEKSRNLMTVRLADHIGMETVAEYAKRFGIMDDMKPRLSYALGAGETTPMKMAAAYAVLVNGGKKIDPSIIDRIQDRRGKTIFQHDDRPCRGCGELIRWEGQGVPDVPDNREQIADPRTAYQMVSILEGVAQRGTAAKLTALGRPLAGKTGTTNESKDTWFMGFSPDLVVGVFMGFDDPRSLGKRETGSSVALPVFYQFMEEALKDVPPMPFRTPPGIKNIRINAQTGARAQPGDTNAIWEAFVQGTEPTDNPVSIDNSGITLHPVNSLNGNPDFNTETISPGEETAPSGTGAGTTGTGTGGLY